MLVWNTHSPVVLRSAPKDLPANLDPSASMRVAGTGRAGGTSSGVEGVLMLREKKPIHKY
jgi:hypothetical protein